MKAVIILGILGLLFGGYKIAGKYGMLDKIIAKVAPKNKASASSLSDEAKDAMKKGAKVINVGVVTWGGYAGGQYFNLGFNASTESRYYKDYGILVNFVLIDDYKASRDAFKAGKIDLLWTTADSIVTEVEAMKDYGIQIVYQADWSRGGDAIVVKHGINSANDLRGKTIAVAVGTPSHTFLLNTLDAAGIPYDKSLIKTTDSAIAAAQMFKSGAVDAAVVWSPDDADCVRNVSGSKVLVSTKKAGNIIADVFYAKKEFVDKNREAVKGLVEGWMKGAAEINTDPAAKEKAIQILMAGLKIDEQLARTSIDNVRLCTYGDNVNFFNVKGSYSGVKGEDLYTKMHRKYVEIGLASASVPMWREIVDASIVQSINLSGLGHDAEGKVTFAAPKKADEQATAYAEKAITVTYATGSAIISDDGKFEIDSKVTDMAKMYRESRIRIEGNTDSVGSRATNKTLSFKRAKSVANYLVAKYGFDPNRFVIVGNGPDKPVADNGTDEGRAQNRRTQVFLLNN